MKKIIIVLLLGILASCSNVKIKQDASVLSPLEAHSPSVVFITDDQGPRRGLAHLILSEGSKPYGIVKVIIPTVKCNRASCAEIQAIRKDGNLIPIGGIKQGENSLSFPISKLTMSSTEVTQADSGAHYILIDIWQEVEDREEMHIQMEGIIYISVILKGYSRLVCDSPSLAYIEQINDTCAAHYSTKLRSALCGKCHNVGYN